MKKGALNISDNSLSKSEFDEMPIEDKIDLFAKNLNHSNNIAKAKALGNIYSKIANQNNSKTAIKLKYYYSVAASILIIILFSVFYLNSLPTRIIASNGENIDHFLPDGSRVIINAGSEISYYENDFIEKRSIELKGEAFFSVVRGNKFQVITYLGEIEVLGTSFNVFARDKSFNVECLTGRVGVLAGKSNVVLEQGEKAELNNNKIFKTSNIDVNKIATWRIGEFNFDNKPLISIFEEIERQFDVNITFTGIDNRFFTGNFSNKNLNEVIETVCLPMKLEYEIIKDKKVRINPKKE